MRSHVKYLNQHFHSTIKPITVIASVHANVNRESPGFGCVTVRYLEVNTDTVPVTYGRTLEVCYTREEAADMAKKLQIASSTQSVLDQPTNNSHP